MAVLTLPGRSRSSRRATSVAAHLFLAPALLMFAGFFVIPFGYALVLSLRRSTVAGGGIGLRVERFIGLANYRDVLSDNEFWHGLVRMLGYSLIVVPVMLGLALLFALLLDAPATGVKRFSRISIFLPYAIPGVIATLLWGFLYLPDVTPLNPVLSGLGLGPVDVLGPRAVFGAVANIAVWGGTGFNMVVMYTSLKAIPGDLYDAARIDGCSEWQLAIRIKIPLLTPALVMTGIFSIIATLQVFSEPWTLRPLAKTISSSWMPVMKVYRDGFINADPYLAAAGSVLLGVVTLVLSLGALRLLQNRAFGEDR